MQICGFIKSESLAQVLCYEFCLICKNTFSPTNYHWTTASDYSPVFIVFNSIEGGELAKERVNYDTKAKACTNLTQKCNLPKNGSPGEI